MQKNQIVQQCTAGITINRNKIKKYDGNKFYLKNKQEFELEICNTLSFTVLAKISINGSLISNSGLVLKPGQKVYLERYIDTSKKFLFETYEVENNNHMVAKAIAQNGNIEISFYKEKEILPVAQYNPITWTTATTQYPYNQYNERSGGVDTYYCNTVASTLTTTNNNILPSGLIKRAKSIETGRVEQGSISNQEFSNYSGEFKSYSFQTIKIKLLPYSAKPIEINDLAEYCTECGTKNKKGNYKFCPKCGHKF